MMNLNTSGIFKKIENNAEWITLAVTMWHRFAEENIGLGGMLEHQLGKGWALVELQRSFASFGALKWKLWESPHLFTSAFKAALMARLGVEFGVVPPKYKKLIEKIMLGAGITALTTMGHDRIADQMSKDTTIADYIQRNRYSDQRPSPDGINPFARN